MVLEAKEKKKKRIGDQRRTNNKGVIIIIGARFTVITVAQGHTYAF